MANVHVQGMALVLPGAQPSGTIRFSAPSKSLSLNDSRYFTTVATRALISGKVASVSGWAGGCWPLSRAAANFAASQPACICQNPNYLLADLEARNTLGSNFCFRREQQLYQAMRRDCGGFWQTARLQRSSGSSRRLSLMAPRFAMPLC